MGRRSFVGLAALLALGACQGKQRTMLVVEIDSNLVVPGELDKVDVAITVNGETPHTPYSLINDYKLPLHVGVVETGDGAGNITIVASGYKGPTFVVSETAIVGFVEGKSMLLKLFLARECIGKTCPNSNQTCTTGGNCRDQVRKPNELTPFTPSDLVDAAPPREDARRTYDIGISDGTVRGGDATDVKLDVPYTADSFGDARPSGNEASTDGTGGAAGDGGTTAMDASDVGDSDVPVATGGMDGNDGSTATGGAGVTDGPVGTGGVAGGDAASATGGTSVTDGPLATGGVDGSDGPREAGGTSIADGPLATDGVDGSDGPSEVGGTSSTDGPMATDGADGGDGPSEAGGASITDGGCVPVACTTASGDQYCGDIGDGCGSPLHCGTTCAKPGWICQDSLCRGPPEVCTPLVCQPASGGQYCGTIGDSCGHLLDCGTDCSAAGSGWVCGSNNVCLGGTDCVKATCNNANGVQQYCGNIGDGCGGTLSCPATCANGVPCGAVTAKVCEPCGGLCLKRIRCSGAATTSISGTVYDPAGLNPLYNVIVSIPNAPLDMIPTGATCSSCDAQVSGQPIAAALTDATGHFVLNNVPWGTDFPLVMQLGKWRRQVSVTASWVTQQCADNPIVEPRPATLLRLPRNIHDGDNSGQYTSIPRIAIAAGNAHPNSLVNGAQVTDSTITERLQCLLRRIGIDASEFSLPGGSSSISLYNQSQGTDTCNQVSGSTATFPDATTNLWDSQAHLNQYDVILLNCGGSQVDPTSTTGRAFIPNPAAVDRMRDYLNGGGRVFAEHYHWAWIKSFTGYPSRFGDVATWYVPSGLIGSAPRDAFIDQSFPKGMAFASWLANVGASMTAGHLPLSSGVTYTAIDQIKPPSQRWIYEPADSGAPNGVAQYTHYFSFKTPIGAPEAQQCGRFSYTAMHVSDSASTGFPGDPAISGGYSFPGCCSTRTELSPQEKALEFMFFDLSGCINPIDLPPPPPPNDALAPPPPPPPPVPTHAAARPGQ